MHAFFIEPLSNVNGWSELVLKASPLCLIGLGLAVGYRANVWNIGAEGQMLLGGIVAGGIAIYVGDASGWWIAAADDAGRRRGRHGVGGDSRAAQEPLQHQRNPRRA